MTDIIIIGAGPGGYETAAYAAKNGLTVAIVEEREVGGTCLNRGCIPTKALVHSAELLRARQPEAINRDDYQCGVDRKDEVVAQLRSGVETILAQPGITLVRGRGVLRDAHTVEVTLQHPLGTENSEATENSEPTANSEATATSELAESSEKKETLTARHIIIATGSRAKMPPVEGIGDASVVTSDELLSLRELPGRLCIVGAGVIGMEFASILATWGVEVTVVEFLKECLPMIDSDIAKRLRKSLEKRGVAFVMQAGVKSIRDGLVTYERKGKEGSVEADLVLVATGRAPQTEGLGLDEAGIAFDRKGITVDDNMQTSVPGVYAIGDVNGRMMLAHAATFQGYRAVNHILGRADQIRLDIMPSAVFTYPEAASVGLSEDAAKAEGIEVSVGKAFHRSNGKSLTMGETEGLLKLIAAKADGRILGCHAYGLHAADMVQEVTALMNRAATVADLQATVHIHPTVGEVLHAAAMTL